VSETAELRFEGRVAIVTGGGRGMGREHCLLLGSRGAQVVVNDLGGEVSGGGGDPDVAGTVAAEITAAGGTAISDGHSIASRDGARALVEHALDAFGRVDIVITNAGIMRRAPFGEADPASLQALLEVNTWGNWHIVQAAWPGMIERGYGRVVCVSSSAGFYGMPGIAAYTTSKAAIIGLVRTLAIEGAESGVLVNAVAPGALSRMTAPIKGPWLSYNTEHLRPEYVAPGVVFLAHELCPVTGRMFSTIGHRMAEIVLGETRGLATAGEQWTLEAVRDGWGQVVDTDGLYAPVSTADAARYAARWGGADLQSYGITLD
jgi:NAD(P)-dependent dehydrogenase (short-subunit alcohol dehydrogenase family)